jgi:hypothetical protein
MPAVAGVVVNGRVELDEKLPEGTRVVVRPEGEELVTLDEKSVRELGEAAQSLDRGEGVPAAKVLKRLARRRTS